MSPMARSDDASGGAPEGIAVVPANRASRADVDAVFGTRGDPARCRCQWFRTTGREFRAMSEDERARRLYVQTQCGRPDALVTAGLIAYLDGEPAGWCAVAPRADYQRLRTARIPWSGRREDRADPDVWAVTCLVTRMGYRNRGVARALVAAAAPFARERDGRAIEGYPLVTKPGERLTWGELFVGSVGMFAAAGFAQVSRPTPRRAVMRRAL